MQQETTQVFYILEDSQVYMDEETDSEDKKNKQRARNILASLDVVKIADSEDEASPVVNVEILRRDINQKLVKIPEFSEDDFREIIEKNGYEYTGFEGSTSNIFKREIPNEDAYEEETKIEKLRQEIKDAQLEFIEGSREQIDVKSQIVEILSSTISRANKKFSIDRDKAFLFFKSLLGSLVERREENLVFMDEEEIDKIVQASLSDTPENVRDNLESLFKDMIVKIRKLFLIFAYDQLTTRIINYHLKEGELSKIQENRYVSVDGAKLRVFTFQAYGKRCFVAIDVRFGDIVTFGLGKKMRTELDPIIHSIFVDRISFYVRKEFLDIMATTMERVKVELLTNLANGIYVDFGRYSSEELVAEREEIDTLTETLYRQTKSVANKIESTNQDYIKSVLRQKMRTLSRVFGGAINQDIYRILPIDMIESSKGAMTKILESNQVFYDFMKKLENDYKKAIEAKSQGKHKLLAETANNIKVKATKYLKDPEKLLAVGKFIFHQIKKFGGG
ncbi:hypothetical protein ACFL6S_30810 [Candidatus Poribacteria bacterium]